MTVDIAEQHAVQGEPNGHSNFITLTNCYQQTPVLFSPVLPKAK